MNRRRGPALCNRDIEPETRIDDVDDDGQAEIWAGDAAGHLYLFRWDVAGQQWTTFYRSQDLGPCPGIYNNLFPVKQFVDVQGNPVGPTVKLLALSPGYVMAFNVRHQALP